MTYSPGGFPRGVRQWGGGRCRQQVGLEGGGRHQGDGSQAQQGMYFFFLANFFFR